MARKRSPVGDYLVYLAVRCVVCLLQTLSWNLAYKLAHLLASVAYRVDKRHRLVAIDNLQKAFPEKSADEIDQIVRGSYRHFCAMVVEMTKGPRVLHPHNLDHHFRYEDPAHFERVVALLKSDRPVILMSGHFGNWEIYGYAVAMFGVDISAIARPIDNPYLDKYLNSFRGATGQDVIAKHGDYDRIHALMKRGGNLAVLADQDAGEKGLFVDFFGRPASTFKSIALLAMEYDAPIVMGLAARIDTPLVFHVHLPEIIDPRDYANQPGAVKAITQRYTATLEAVVRQHPEQYLWLHRRWKHQPPIRKAKAAA